MRRGGARVSRALQQRERIDCAEKGCSVLHPYVAPVERCGYGRWVNGAQPPPAAGRQEWMCLVRLSFGFGDAFFEMRRAKSACSSSISNGGERRTVLAPALGLAGLVEGGVYYGVAQSGASSLVR